MILLVASFESFGAAGELSASRGGLEEWVEVVF
jgi:hypothetical protein